MKAKILSTSALPGELSKHLHGFAYVAPACGQMDSATIEAEIQDADALISLLSIRVDEDFLERGKSLKVIANYAVGFDNIDIEAATRRGIAVCNTPDVLTNATADLAFALLLAAARRVGEGERLLRRGDWQGWAPSLLLGRELFQRKLGVVGAGRIGCAMMRRAKGFGMELYYTSRSQSSEAEALGARRVKKEELLGEADVVSLHCPYNDDTHHWIDETALSSMKSTAVLINTARGGCIDYQALLEALRSKAIFAAGLDVFPNEPAVPQGFCSLENAVLLPHLGSATEWARAQMAHICAESIRAILLDGKVPPNVLNPHALGSELHPTRGTL